MKILITGGSGQLGRELAVLFQDNARVIAPGSKELDIRRREQVLDCLLTEKPDLVIHAAAMTDVDGCEEDRDTAYLANAFGTQNIALACQTISAELVYISSDFVFSGDQEEPYLEFDQTGPVNIYGKSKLAGENYVRSLMNKYYIVRTAWLYGQGHNFVKTMLRLAGERDSLRVVNDQVGSPTSARELAAAVCRLTQSGLYGTYHATNNGSCSWYEFAGKVFALKGMDVKVNPVSSVEFKRPAVRPAYSVLRNYALEMQGIYQMRHWEEALEEYLKGPGE